MAGCCMPVVYIGVLHLSITGRYPVTGTWYREQFLTFGRFNMQIGKFIFHAVFWRAIYLVSVFALNILLARSLGAADSGQIFLAVNNLAFLLLAASGCLETGLTYYTATKQIPLQQLSTLSIVWSVIATLFIVSVFFLLPADTGTGLPVSQPLLLWLIAAYVWGVLLTTYFTPFFYAHKKFTVPNQLLAAINLIAIVYIWLQYRLGDPANLYVRIAGAFFISFFLQGIVLYGAFRRQFAGAIQWQLPGKADLLQIWRYIRVALLVNIVFFLVYRIDYWLVAAFCDDGELGNYIQVSKIAQVFLLLPGMLAVVIFPVTAGDESNTAWQELPVLSRLMFLLYLLVLLVLFACGRFLFPLLYGTTFTGMYAAFTWLVPGILALSVQALLTAYYAGKNKLAVNLRGALLALVVIAAGGFLFIPRYGINGAAAVSSISYIVYMIYMIAVFTRQHPVKPILFFLPQKEDWHWVKRQLLHKDE